MSDSPAAVLVDSSGSFHSLLSGSTIQDGTPGLGIMGKDTTGKSRFASMTTDGVLRVAQSSTPATSLIVSGVHSGSATNMNVDGSSTTAEFTFDAHPTNDLSLNSLTIVLVPNVLRVDDASFGSLSALTNGVRVTVTANSVENELAIWKVTEDILVFGSVAPVIETGLTANDLMVTIFDFGGAFNLKAGTSDNVKIEIRDDLTSAGPNSIVAFKATVKATIL